MAKGLVPVFFTTCGVVMAGLIGYGVLKSQESNKASQSIEVQQQSQSVVPPQINEEGQEVANTSPQENDDKADDQTAKVTPSVVAEASEEVTLKTPNQATSEAEDLIDKDEDNSNQVAVKLISPVFDIVRVEPDGSAVIAGKGNAGHKIILLDKAKQLAETKANANGEFVFVLDTPLSPGAHELSLQTISEKGDVTQSQSFAFVDVPKPNQLGDVTVLLAEVGKATKLLQKPAVKEVKVPVAEELPVEPEEKTASLEPSQTDVKKETDVKQETAEVAETIEEPKPVVDLKPVLIEAAEIEADKVFIAGTGEPNKMVTLYIDNNLLGSVRIADNGAYLFEGTRDIKAGRYDVRADMTEPGSRSVVARAEVKLIHEPQVASVEPQQTADAESEVQPKVEPAPKAEEASQAETKPETVQATQGNSESDPETEYVQETVVEAEPKPEPVKSEEQEVVQVQQPESTEDNQETSTHVEEQEDVDTRVVAITEEDTASLNDEPAVDEANDEQKPEIRTGSAVIIRRGDNLWTVARRNYGAGIRYTTIFEANRDQVRNPHKIFPGQVLKVPENEEDAQ